QSLCLQRSAGKAAQNLLIQQIHVRRRLFDAHAGFQSSHNVKRLRKIIFVPPQLGGTCFIIDSGTHTSGAWPTFVPKNSGGATPTMLNVVSPSLIFLPSTEESSARLRSTTRS